MAKKDSRLALRYILTCFGIVQLTAACPQKCKCLDKTIHCDSKELKKFPSSLPDATVQLFIENNSIETVESLKYMNQSHLRTLRLQNNRITYLTSCAFCSAIGINYLDLSNNTITTLSKDTFLQLKHLTLLNLAQNRINNFSPRTFADLIAIRDLHLSGNLVSTLPSGIFSSLSKLNSLKLSHNFIEKIPDDLFYNLSSLTSLDLSYNRIQRITSSGIRGLVKLQTLNLKNNKIRSIDSQFAIPKEQCSELNDNSAEELSESISSGAFFDLRELRTINLSNNQLASVRYSSFSSLPQLENVGLKGNHWRCDCFLIWSLMRLNSDQGNNRLVRGHMTCWEPDKLRGVPVENLSIQDLSYEESLPKSLEKSREVKQQQSFLNSKAKFITDLTQEENLATSSMTLSFNLNISEKVTSERNLILTTLPDRLNATFLFQKASFQGNQEAFIALNGINETPQKILKRNSHENLATMTKQILTTEGAGTFFKRNERSKEYNNTDRKDDDKERGELISWLLVAAIFTSALAITVCGAVALNKQCNKGRRKNGCCKKRSSSTRQTTESIRSYSNYPLLYDNPLARRPLPRQPMHLEQEQSRFSQPMKSRRSKGQVDIQWTSGGTFGIGDIDQCGSRLLRTPNQNYARRNHENFQPKIPPRIPIQRQYRDTAVEDDLINSRLMIDSAQNVTNAPYNHFPSPSSAPLIFSDIRSNRKPISATHYQSDQDLGSSKYYKRRSYPKNQRKRPESSIGIEKDPHTGEFFLRANIQRNDSKEYVFAPVKGQSTKERSANREAREGTREHVVMQMLEALEEIETLRRNSNSVVDTNNTFKQGNTSANREFRRGKIDIASPSILQEYDEEFRKFVSEPIQLKNINKLNLSNNKRKSMLSHAQPKNLNTLDRKKVRKRVRRNACHEHFSHISDVDFEFPPPPPWATMSCSEDSPTFSSSVSEASYNIDLPPPPSCCSSESVLSFEIPTTSSCKLETQRKDTSLNDQDNSYSVLALCSTGKEKSTPKISAQVILESDYKNKKECSRNIDWKYGRKDSADSMFVSIDSPCSSLLTLDFEHDHSEKATNTVTSTNTTCVSEEANHTPQTKLKDTAKQTRTKRLRQLKAQYRKSMPIYNDLLLKSKDISDVERQRLLERSKSLLRLTKPVEEKINKYHPIRRITCLEMSCSESETDEALLQRNFAVKDHTGCHNQSLNSSTNSILEESQIVREKNKKKSVPNNSNQCKTENLSSNRKLSISSFGSESVSSIEFGRNVPKGRKICNNFLLARCQTNVEEPPTASRNTRAVRKNDGVIEKDNKILRNEDIIKGQESSKHGHNFSAYDKKRCYFDVIESSADEGSTVVERFNLGAL